ncbi:MAG: hypothetical protein U1E27_03075, partial [Kiritimatiellia bacterium]|nr:hypothetical protein [Kiritimatiellia bacterium]
MSLIKLRLQTVAGLLWIIGLRGAWAILVAGTDPSIQTNAPVDNPGFENVGFMLPGTGSFQASGVYIGSNWILTAFHVYQFDAPTGMVV